MDKVPCYTKKNLALTVSVEWFKTLTPPCPQYSKSVTITNNAITSHAFPPSTAEFLKNIHCQSSFLKRCSCSRFYECKTDADVYSLTLHWWQPPVSDFCKKDTATLRCFKTFSSMARSPLPPPPPRDCGTRFDIYYKGCQIVIAAVWHLKALHTCLQDNGSLEIFRWKLNLSFNTFPGQNQIQPPFLLPYLCIVWFLALNSSSVRQRATENDLLTVTFKKGSKIKSQGVGHRRGNFLMMQERLNHLWYR